MNNLVNSNSATAEKAFKYDSDSAGATSYIEDFIGERKQPFSKNYLVAKPTIKIQNIPFVITESKDEYILYNYQWPSLVSSGRSIKEAIDNATDLLLDVVEQYVYESEENLSKDGIEFRKYLLVKLFS